MDGTAAHKGSKAEFCYSRVMWAKSVLHVLAFVAYTATSGG